MAPSRGKGKVNVYPLRKSSPAHSNRRTTRAATARRNDGVPEVYKDLLAEASTNNSDDIRSDRPLKKRKVTATGSASKRSKQNLQTVEDSSASSDNSDESEFEFEDVDLEEPTILSPAGAPLEEDSIADVSVAIQASKAPKRTQVSKRKAATPAEKAHRLLVHKLHILCLLGHLMYVNTWCNDNVVQQHLLELLPKKTRSYLTHNPEFSQFQQNRSFMDGLQQACEAWRGAFSITTSGLRRAKWSEAGYESRDSELDPLGRGEFQRAAKDLEGSQDTGNQLFCALLRAVGVDARVVCSVQVLPFGSNSKDKAATPKKEFKKTVFATPSGIDSPATDSNAEDATMQNSSAVVKVPSARRRLGQPSFSNTPPPTTVTPKKRPIRKLTYPVFWVEAFNRAHQTWVPVDPLVTQTIGKASKLGPPGSYEWNQMSYVIAIESDGVARDVTKRYAKAYNAKTRRLRVESAEPNGTSWLRRALRIFKRPRSDEVGRDRDQIEDAQLAQREAQEGLPNNVQDFKHHPYYALERHLRRHEVIHPRREVGKVNAGTAAKPRMEAVFRRGDVQACRSAEKWFRVGHEIKEGEQPLKRVPARRIRNVRLESDGEAEPEALSALYAPFQTRLYVPPPVVKGRVPRNAYGNLDVYVPSMVPPGGAHIRHPLAKEAARILRIDGVDAVTGFKFQGRQGTAVIEGIVVAEEYRDAVDAAIDGLQDDQSEREGMARSALALKMWKRFLTALRIKERVSAYGDGTAEDEDDVDMMEDRDDMGNAAGGFLAEDAKVHEEGTALPTAGKYSLAELLDATPSKASSDRKKRQKDSDESEEAELSDNHYSEQDDEFEPEPAPRNNKRNRRTVVEEESEDDDLSAHDNTLTQFDGLEDGQEGGFMPQDDMGGGFVVNDETDANHEPMQSTANGGGFIIDEGDRPPPSQTLDREIQLSSQAESINDKAAAHDVEVHMRDRSATPAPRAPTPVCEDEQSQAISNTPAFEAAAADKANLSEPAQSTHKDSSTGPTPQLEWQVHGVAEAQQHEWPHEADDDSDRGSMLSHDPDDEDAEPDWLESD